jgi:hypothetical protein
LATPRAALLLGAIGVVLLAAAIPLAVLAHQLTVGGLGFHVILLPFAIVGFTVARRVPGNPIGWILLAVALAMWLTGDNAFYAVRAYRLGHPGLPLARLTVFLSVGWIWMLVLMPLPIALFPDGHLPSPRWRWTMWLYLAVCALFIAGLDWSNAHVFVAHHIRVDSSGELLTGRSSSEWASITAAIAFLLAVGIALSWVVGQLLKFRRATGEQRQQLKWLLSGATICIVGVVLGNTLASKHGVLGALAIIGWVGIVALPTAIGVGVLKYRLFEIDRLISRTLSYLVITGLLVGLFVGIVALSTDVLPFSSPVGVAASTLVAAALFNPLRLRVQRLVDRRFNRARYDAEAIVSAFTLRLRDAVDLETVRGELLRAVNGAVQPTHASVWIRPPSARSTR